MDIRGPTLKATWKWPANKLGCEVAVGWVARIWSAMLPTPAFLPSTAGTAKCLPPLPGCARSGAEKHRAPRQLLAALGEQFLPGRHVARVLT